MLKNETENKENSLKTCVARFLYPQGEINKFRIKEYFIIALSVFDSTINKLVELMEIYRTLHLKTAEHVFFSSEFQKIE